MPVLQRKRFWWQLLSAALWQALPMLIFGAVAAGDEDQGKHNPAPMVFSYVDYDYIIDVALPLVRDSYNALGIDVTFVQMPSHREMLEVSSGNIDGSVIASRELFSRYDGIVPVEPAITESVFLLLCRPLLPCDARVLNDENATIAMTEASEKALKHRFASMRATPLALNVLSAIPELVTTGRVDFGVIVVEQSELLALEMPNAVFYELFRNPAHHVIADKHKHRADDIGRALAQQLNSLPLPAN